MNKFAKWLRDESDHHLSRGTKHPIGDDIIYSVQVGMIHAADEIDDLVAQISEPWCYEGGGQAVNGSCPTHNGDACLRTPEGLIKLITVERNESWDSRPKYDSEFGDDKSCKCGHPYYRHFDTYEHMYPCGCKYCECYTFELCEEFQFETNYGRTKKCPTCYARCCIDLADQLLWWVCLKCNNWIEEIDPPIGPTPFDARYPDEQDPDDPLGRG